MKTYTCDYCEKEVIHNAPKDWMTWSLWHDVDDDQRTKIQDFHFCSIECSASFGKKLTTIKGSKNTIEGIFNKKSIVTKEQLLKEKGGKFPKCHWCQKTFLIAESFETGHAHWHKNCTCADKATVGDLRQMEKRIIAAIKDNPPVESKNDE